MQPTRLEVLLLNILMFECEELAAKPMFHQKLFGRLDRVSLLN